MSTLAIILIVVLIVVVAAGGWGLRGSYGSNVYYGPGFALVALVILILLVLVLTGNLNV